MSFPQIIDAHAHCGRQDRSFAQDFEDYQAAVAGSDIRGVVMFPPVGEIYDRHDVHFADNPPWQKRRARANDYLLELGTKDLRVIPYFFIWNDFAVDRISPRHQGIKWHRHQGEPPYHYDDPAFAAALARIRQRNLPVVLEEEFHNTVRFVEEWGRGVRVIIPHLGALNGGYGALLRSGVFNHPHVWADTALAAPSTIRDYLARFGPDRLLFGSDFPFGDPLSELEKVRDLALPGDVEAGVLGGNLRRILGKNRP